MRLFQLILHPLSPLDDCSGPSSNIPAVLPHRIPRQATDIPGAFQSAAASVLKVFSDNSRKLLPGWNKSDLTLSLREYQRHGCGTTASYMGFNSDDEIAQEALARVFDGSGRIGDLHGFGLYGRCSS